MIYTKNTTYSVDTKQDLDNVEKLMKNDDLIKRYIQISMKKVLVIGGSGFVGSHTSDSLSEAGYQVTIFDRLESKWIREDQEMIIGDMMDDKSLRAVMKNKDYVFHFGGIADIGEADKNPYEAINLNVMSVMKIY